MSSTSLSCSSPLALLVSGTPSSDDKQNDSSFRDANAMLNVPIEDGDITAASGLQKLRRKALPPLPSNQRFVIPPAYQTTYGSKLFLIYDKRKSAYGGRLLMFASEEQ
ncbi:unnamed protein product [Rotaria magnacalcarata]|uniref:Uncharacterized protein n=1 Tax=Rotaria magnacalcarata TaxID=392030 RepID=A0A816KFA1_9BILA|nr:unnamed protein product [Rotaria magnacalcarata]